MNLTTHGYILTFHGYILTTHDYMLTTHGYILTIYKINLILTCSYYYIRCKYQKYHYNDINLKFQTQICYNIDSTYIIDTNMNLTIMVIF